MRREATSCVPTRTATGKCRAPRPLPPQHRKSDEWFDKLDLNKDGYVTQDEIKQAHEARREQMHEMFDEHFKAADTNNDGKLSLEEVQAKMPRLAEHFSQLDTDKDGFLSKEELQHGGPGGYGGHHKPRAGLRS